jgi:hypothetical protein
MKNNEKTKYIGPLKPKKYFCIKYNKNFGNNPRTYNNLLSMINGNGRIQTNKC